MKITPLILLAGSMFITACQYSDVETTDTVSGTATKYVLSSVQTTDGNSVSTDATITDSSGNDSYTQYGLVFTAGTSTITFDSSYNLITNNDSGTGTTKVYNTRGLKESETVDTTVDDGFIESNIVYSPTAGEGLVQTTYADGGSNRNNAINDINLTTLHKIQSGTKINGTLTEYAANGYKNKETVYDASGQITSVTTFIPTAAAATIDKTVYTYDATTNILTNQKVSENGMLVSDKDYDANGLVLKEVNLTYGATKVTNSEIFSRNGGISLIIITDHTLTDNTLADKYAYDYNDTNSSAPTFNETFFTDANNDGAYDVTLGVTTTGLTTTTVDAQVYPGDDFVTGAPANYKDYSITYGTGSFILTTSLNINSGVNAFIEEKKTYDATTGYISLLEDDNDDDNDVDVTTIYTDGVQSSVISDTDLDDNINQYEIFALQADTATLITTSTIVYTDNSATIAASTKVTEVTQTIWAQAVLNISYQAGGLLYDTGVTSDVRTYDSAYNLLTYQQFDGAISTSTPFYDENTTYDADSYKSSVKVSQTIIEDVDADGSFENKIVRSWGDNGLALGLYLANANAQTTLNLAAANTNENWFDADEVKIEIYKDNQTTPYSSMNKTFVANDTANYRSHVDGFVDTTLVPTITGNAYSTIDILNNGYHLTTFVLDQEGTANDETRTFTYETKER